MKTGKLVLSISFPLHMLFFSWLACIAKEPASQKCVDRSTQLTKFSLFEVSWVAISFSFTMELILSNLLLLMLMYEIYC